MALVLWRVLSHGADASTSCCGGRLQVVCAAHQAARTAAKQAGCGISLPDSGSCGREQEVPGTIAPARLPASRAFGALLSQSLAQLQLVSQASPALAGCRFSQPAVLQILTQWMLSLAPQRELHTHRLTAYGTAATQRGVLAASAAVHVAAARRAARALHRWVLQC